MTKVSYVVTYPDKTKKVVKTLAEAQEVKALGGSYKLFTLTLGIRADKLFP